MLSFMSRRKLRMGLGAAALALVTAAGITALLNSGTAAAPGAGGPPNRKVTGVGEPSLVIVTAGEFSTEDEALAASQALSLGEVQGFYVDATGNYRVLGSYARVSPDFVPAKNPLGEIQRLIPPAALRYRGDGVGPALTPGKWLLLSAFRTLHGAQEFIDLVRAVTGQTDFLTLRVKKIGGGYVGLGQEPHPDGSGPLSGPIPDQERFQK